MPKSKQKSANEILEKPSASWLEHIDFAFRRMVVPVGAQFQADVPDWTGPPNGNCCRASYNESGSSVWLGTQVWPIEESTSVSKKLANVERIHGSDTDVIGRGRPDYCSCETPGSIDCVRRHVNMKRFKLQAELGPAFWRWKFDEMGEEVSKSWTLEEQQQFHSLVKANPTSQNKSFLKPALASLRSQNKQSIVSYYLNVYVPRRICNQTRSGCRIVDTDDEESGEVLNSRGPSKRCRADNVTSYSSKFLKLPH